MSGDPHSFRAPRHIVVGRGAAAQLGTCLQPYRGRVLLVTGERSASLSGGLDRASESLRHVGVEAVVFDQVRGEPTLRIVDEARTLARRHDCTVIVGLGGGSAIDAAKCTAGLLRSSAPTEDHFKGLTPIPDVAAPWAAVPLTSGAGAEATPNAVLIDERDERKESLRSWSWLASVVLVDPELTVSCPARVTAETGMDALTQAIESYTSRWATPITEALSFEAAVRIGKHLARVYYNGNDLEARDGMSWGSTMAGVALANARLGAVHGLAHAVGMACGVSHGRTCGILLPWVMEYNSQAAGTKYARLASALGLVAQDTSEVEATDALLQFVRQLKESLGIPHSLGQVGLRRGMILAIVEESLQSGSMKANPRVATSDDVTELLVRNLTG